MDIGLSSDFTRKGEHRMEPPNDLRTRVKALVPETVYRPVVSRWRRWTRERVRGDLLERSVPISDVWGLDRGTPIDRWYTEDFLRRHAADIKGRVLEMADARYTRRFGGNRVSQSDVLHLIPGNPDATIIGDLVTGEGIPQSAFNSLIVINTFPIIYEVEKAIQRCASALKPGGVLLANFHSIYPGIPEDPAWRGDFWRFTSMSVRRLCGDVFGDSQLTVEPVGNVRSAAAFLYGIAAEELTEDALRMHDPRYEVLINLRAQR